MVHFGNHFRTTAHSDQRERVKSFFIDVLSCECVAETPDLDVFRFANHTFFGVYYSDDPGEVLTQDEFKKATWAEIKTDAVEALKDKITGWGIRPFDYKDKDHFYFHAPWGQVFRIAPMDE